MRQIKDLAGSQPVSGMAIVDTFTRLIFGEEAPRSAEESLIIQALRQVDQHVSLDDDRAVGEYLRAMGVEEMIGLVSRVRSHIADTAGARRRVRGEPGVSRRSRGSRGGGSLPSRA